MEVYIIRDPFNRYYGWTFDRAKAAEQAEIIRSETGLSIEVEEVCELEEVR